MASRTGTPRSRKAGEAPWIKCKGTQAERRTRNETRQRFLFMAMISEEPPSGYGLSPSILKSISWIHRRLYYTIFLEIREDKVEGLIDRSREKMYIPINLWAESHDDCLMAVTHRQEDVSRAGGVLKMAAQWDDESEVVIIGYG